MSLPALTSLDPPALSLAASILLVTNLTVRCHTPPNPNPTAPKETDRVGRLASPFALFTRQSVVYAAGIYHAILCLTYPSPLSSICPRPENLSSHLFTWSTRTIVCILLVLVAAPIRLMTFMELGPNFTFKIAPPGKLITTGLYSWVQHPSYTCNTTIILVIMNLFLSRDGVAACWLPKVVADGERFGAALTIGAWAMRVIVICMLSIRVRDEEAMLEKTFGKEWEVYNAKTKRFIPFVF